MREFDSYYHEYLGIEDPQINQSDYFMVHSDYREKPINNEHFFPVMITQYKNRVICSCVPELKPLLQGLNYLHIKNKVKNVYPFVEWQTYLRFSLEQNNKTIHNSAQVLTPFDYCLLYNLKQVNEIQPNLLILLNEQRCFTIVKNGKIVSHAHISDVYAGGANIVVSTHPNYRGKGYAKEVVAEALNYCRINQLLPIYFAREENKASIKVAQSLGLKLKSREENAYFVFKAK